MTIAAMLIVQTHNRSTRTHLTHIVTVLLVALAPLAAHATWYSENIPNGSDIIMMDLRWPWWPSGTYYANWNSSFNPKPNNISFYGGFVSGAPSAPGGLPNLSEELQSKFRPGNVWTFWGAGADGSPVRFTDVAPNLYIRNDYGGEGSSGTMGSVNWPFVTSRQWYTMLARVWQPTKPDGHAYVGRWIKDIAANEWHLIGIARLPIPAVSFAGNSGFIEPLEGENTVRSLHRRLGYARKDGKWAKTDTISIDHTEYVVVNKAPEGDHEYVAIEYAQRPDHLPQMLTGHWLPGDQKVSFTVKQPDLPNLDAPASSHASAVRCGNQVCVKWDAARNSSPLFGYRIELFDNPSCKGSPIAVKQELDPSTREALILATMANSSVRLTLVDVFDHHSVPIIINPIDVHPSPAVAAPRRLVPGLNYTLSIQDKTRKQNYFNSSVFDPNESHRWVRLAELAVGTKVRSGISRGLDAGIREERGAGFALRYHGYLRAPNTGLYLFHSHIDGAYRLRIDLHNVIVRDGQYGTAAKAECVALTAGLHSIEVDWLYDELPAANFGIDWEGPGLSLQPIGVNSLATSVGGNTPSAIIRARETGNGTAAIEVRVDAAGAKVERTDLYLGALLLAQSHDSHLIYAGAMPEGSNLLRARVVFDKSHTVDSAPVTLKISGQPFTDNWVRRNAGDKSASAGLWQTSEDSFQFFGNGMHTVMRAISGDFTATCRVDHYNGAHGEPVNPNAWVGITAQERPDKINWEWGKDFYLVQTAAQGIRASADFTDFGATRMTSNEVSHSRPWLRIVRQGDVWTAWTSADGAKWDMGAYQSKICQKTMNVGLFFSALPQDARAHYSASVSHLSVEAGIRTETALPMPTSASGTSGIRLTGVIVSRSHPTIAIARSCGFGVLKTENGGKSWRAINDGLPPDALAVRSVAIHPKDASRMLLAAGNGRSSSLWRTSDGGSHWTKLSFSGDFDGAGPSALCGEVLGYDLRNPDIVYAGCESKGFFRSDDGGDTWRLIGAANERNTAVVVWPWERYYPAPAHGKTHVCVITCPDRFMNLLGRGEPTIATTGQTSRGYLSPDGVQTLQVADERSDCGFYNVVFDKALQSVNEMRYATSLGYQSEVFQNSQMALYPPQKGLDWLRPYTAIGAAALGDEKFGRVITQALNPVDPGEFSLSEQWAFEWSRVKVKDALPHGGMIAAACDERHGQRWFFVCTDGLFVSEDGGKTLVKALTEVGDPTK